MTNCPPKYQNIQCESFGNKRKITSQLLRQFCKNDAYLKQEIDKLWDTTDPESRKRFYPNDYIDITNSFGIGDKKLSSLETKDYFYSQKVHNFNTINRFKYIFDLDLSNDYTGEVYNDTINTQCLDIHCDSLLDLENTYETVPLEIVADDDGKTLRPPLSVESYLNTIFHDNVYETVTEDIIKKAGTKYVTQKKETLGKAKKDAHFYGAYNNWNCNNHWYNGFDRTKNYNVKSAWKKDPYGEDKNIIRKYGRIPSVCHAQTFKAQSNGKITKVSLNIQGSKGAVSPCTVEIRATKSGKPTDTVLARTEKKFSGTGENIVAFEFKKDKAMVTKGKTYAIVVRSPFSHFDKCYRLGGWTTGCFSSSSKYYGDGSSYTSTDNGHTWVKNGKTSDTKSYGSHYYDWGINQKPVDFAFEVYVAPVSAKTIKKKVASNKSNKNTVTNTKTYQKLVKEAYTEKHTYEYIFFKQGAYYLYLKPIRTNPIDWFEIDSTFIDSRTGELANGSKYWHWEYYNPKESRWEEVEGNMHDFDNTHTNYTVLKLRVRCDVTQNTFGGLLTVDNALATTDDYQITNELVTANKLVENPLTFLKNFTVRINCYEPSTAYLKTHYYTPSKTDILGASIWSEVGAKAQTLGNATLEIDIIHQKENVEHIQFYDLNIIQDMDLGDNGATWTDKQLEIFEAVKSLISEYTMVEQTYKKANLMIDYIISQYEMEEENFVSWCKKRLLPVYYLPLKNYNDNYYEFFSSVTLSDYPSYPLLAGDIGEPDIQINPKQFERASDYGFAYRIDSDIKDCLNSVLVTYKTNVTVALNEDDEGFELGQEGTEHIEEKLNGLILDTTDETVVPFTGGVVAEGIFPLDMNSNKIPVSSSGVYSSVDYAYCTTSDGNWLIFNSHSPVILKLFPNRYNVDNNNVSLNTATVEDNDYYGFATTLTGDNVSDFELKVDLVSKTFQEFIDFTVDYNNKTLKFYDNDLLINGDFKITYNPLWVRGLSIEDFPLKMDLWKEHYRVGEDGIYRRRLDLNTGQYVDDITYDKDRNRLMFEKTHINPLTKEVDNINSYYCFETTVPARDNIRRLVVNEGGADEKDLVEDSQFFVDYLTNTVVLYTTDINVDDVLTIHYTPNLTDDGLALAYRLNRPRYDNDGNVVESTSEDYLSAQPKPSDDVYIGMNYFTYRT